MITPWWIITIDKGETWKGGDGGYLEEVGHWVCILVSSVSCPSFFPYSLSGLPVYSEVKTVKVKLSFHWQSSCNMDQTLWNHEPKRLFPFKQHSITAVREITNTVHTVHSVERGLHPEKHRKQRTRIWETDPSKLALHSHHWRKANPPAREQACKRFRWQVCYHHNPESPQRRSSL